MLDLGYNNFSGPIPSELQNLLLLEYLWVRSSCNKCFSQINFTTWHWFRFWWCRFLKGNRISEYLPVGLRQLNRICEPENQVPTATARIATIKTRRQLVSRRKDFEMVNITVLPGSPKVFQPSNSPGAPSPSEPIPPPPAPPSQENKNKISATMYASIGAAVAFLVVASSGLCFFYYCHKKTSTVVPLSTNTSSRLLQTTTMEGCLIC